jgi:type IV pilus assembly protein PilM
MALLRSSQAVVGVDWTGQELRMVAVSRRAGSWEVWAQTTIACQIGDWTESAKSSDIERAVAQLVRENRLRGARAVFSLPLERVLVRYTQAPRLPAAALRQAMELELGSTLHVPFDHPVLDVVPVPRLSEDEDETPGDLQSVCLVVTDRTLVESLSTVLSRAGLRPVAAEIAPLALWRLVRPQIAERDMSVWVQMDGGQLSISIFLGAHLYFLRTITDADRRFDPGEAHVEFLVNDLAYETERVTNFFNFSLAGQEYTPQNVWLHALSHRIEVARLLEERLQRPVYSVEPGQPVGLPSEVEPRWYVAWGLALRGFTP